MPKIETWDHLPVAVREHLIERMRDRSISIADLNQLRLWIESKPEVPEGDWYKDFGSFKICGENASSRWSSSQGEGGLTRSKIRRFAIDRTTTHLLCRIAGRQAAADGVSAQ